MPDNHVLTYMENSPESVAYLSIQPPVNLIVFVHGFAGHPTKTWGDFIHVVRNHSEFSSSDIIFYKYHSLKHHMAASALDLYSCLSVWKDLPKFQTVKSEPPTYKRIIFVAHSLGALVVRQALLYAQRDGESWIDQTKMLLFAPAHKGARIIDLCQKCLFGKYAALGYLAQWFVPVLGDLKEGSEPIREVIKLNEDLLKDGKGAFTKAKFTVHAINDKTIIPGLYCGDPTPKADREHDHISVCKPKLSEFETPVQYLKAALV